MSDVEAVLPEHARGKPLEIWVQDEARVGEIGTLTYVSHPGRWYGWFLNRSGFSLCQSFIACKGVLLPRAACGSCWL